MWHHVLMECMLGNPRDDGAAIAAAAMCWMGDHTNMRDRIAPDLVAGERGELVVDKPAGCRFAGRDGAAMLPLSCIACRPQMVHRIRIGRGEQPHIR